MYKLVIASLALFGLVSAGLIKDNLLQSPIVVATVKAMDRTITQGYHELVAIRDFTGSEMKVSFTGDFIVRQYDEDIQPTFKTCGIIARYMPWADIARLIEPPKCVERPLTQQ